MSLVIYIHSGRSDQLGIDWTAILGQTISTAIPVGVGLIGAHLQGQQQSGGRAETEGAIAALIDNLNAEFRGIERTGDLVASLQAAEAFLAILNSDQAINQAHGGGYLAQAKQVIGDEVTRLRGLVGGPVVQTANGPMIQTPTGLVPVGTQGTQTSQPSGETTIAGFPLTTVLLAVGAGVVIWKVL